MADIQLIPDTSVWMRIDAEPSIVAELAEHLSFFVEGYQFTPLYKKGYWDGTKCLVSKLTGRIYRGLAPRIVRWAKTQGYTVQDDTRIKRTWKPEDSATLSASLHLPATRQPRDYQARAIHYGLHYQNGIVISPTGSGKSLILYHWVKATDKPVLIIVPRIQLVKQLAQDFRDYGWTTMESEVYQLSRGASKQTDKRVVIATWHSIYKQSQLWFNRFDMVICDEVHLAQAQSIVDIMEKCRYTRYRLGCTGTLKDSKAHKWVLEGLFGQTYTTEKTASLQQRGYLAPIKIHRIVLDWEFPETLPYAKPSKRRGKDGWSYHDESKFLATNAKRNRFIGKLALGVPDSENTLLLFTFVENHGKLLEDWFQSAIPATQSFKRAFFVAGETPADEREAFRSLTEQESGIILIASSGTFSTGINITRLHHLIFGCSHKSEYRVLQSIGRGLRTHPTKHVLHVYDIVDSFFNSCGYNNYTYIHSQFRLDYYKREQFPVTTSVIPFIAE